MKELISRFPNKKDENAKNLETAKDWISFNSPVLSVFFRGDICFEIFCKTPMSIDKNKSSRRRNVIHGINSINQSDCKFVVSKRATSSVRAWSNLFNKHVAVNLTLDLDESEMIKKKTPLIELIESPLS